MIEVDIPGFKALSLQNIVCDYNGTLAINGQLISGVKDAINELSDKINIHVITADTFGVAKEQLSDVDCTLTISPKENQAQWKLNYIHDLGSQNTVTIGNGRNDRLMLKESILGIALLQQEGTSVETLMMSDIVCHSILDALAYINHPKRIIATLRS